MTGLDQEMMQKNISVNNIGNAQKNMLTFSTVILFVNFLFLFLGGCLYLFAAKNGIVIKGDDLFPTIALGGQLSTAVSILFIIGLISALFPSADGALTALTSSFCIDILGLKRKKKIIDNDSHEGLLQEVEDEKIVEAKHKKTRITVHLLFALLFFICVMIFKLIDDKSIIDVILKLAGYTYGPLLGLFSFGILTKRSINDKIVLPLCILAPALTLIIDMINNAEWFIKKLTLTGSFAAKLSSLSETIFGGYKIGIELLVINGLITFLLLFLFSKKGKNI